MRAAIPFIVAGLLAAPLVAPALAISTLQDTLRDLPRISRSPSTVPPNNAARRNFNSRSAITSDGVDDRDEGPDASTSPTTAPGEAFPFTTALSDGPDLDRNFICAGALISPNWVITAAHCIYNIAKRWPNDHSAFAFTHTGDLAAPGKRRFAIERIVMHPQYDARTLKNDIALVRIDAKGGEAGPPIRLEGPPATHQVGEVVSILGWGITTSESNRQHRAKLQIIQSSVLDSRVCFGTTNFPALRGPNVFCAKSLLKHHDICFRFGGSPIVLFDDQSRLYLQGIVSWPAACPTEGRKPNIYVDVQAYVPWIKSIIDAS